MKLSSRVETLPSSGIRKIFDRAVELELGGATLIRFDVGQPALQPPGFAREAAQRALDEGFSGYTANRGRPELLASIAQRLAGLGLSYDPADELIVTNGASEAVAVALFAVLEPGAEVLIPEPAWPHYAACAHLAGATPVSVPLDVDEGLALTRERLEAHVTPRTRLLVVNSPSNPTGVVQTEAALREALAFAEAHDLLVVADEIYDELIYGERPPSFAALPGARARTILINGFSKAFGMTGWRLGYLAAPRELSAHLNKPHQYMTVCANAFAQMGAAVAYGHPETPAFLEQARAAFRAKRDALFEELSVVEGLRCAQPDGAFYAFPALPAGVDGMAAARTLLEEAHVAAVPGEVFGGAFGGFLRLSYGSCTVEQVREGARRLVATLYRSPA